MENQKVYVAIGCDGKIRCIYGDRASCEKHCKNYSDLFLAEMTIAQSKNFIIVILGVQVLKTMPRQ